MLNRKTVLKIVTLSVVFATASWPFHAAEAMPVKSQLLKARAFFVEGEGGLFEPLDLKSKSLRTQAEVETCGLNMVRKQKTLDYSCTLKIPSNAKISKLQNLVTAKKLEVIFGGLKKEVQIQVSQDAKSITYSTSFDKTGLDFDVLKFNEDFAISNAKLAHLILAEAMKQPVRIEVLEAR